MSSTDDFNLVLTSLKFSQKLILAALTANNNQFTSIHKIQSISTTATKITKNQPEDHSGY